MFLLNMETEETFEINKDDPEKYPDLVSDVKDEDPQFEEFR